MTTQTWRWQPTKVCRACSRVVLPASFKRILLARRDKPKNKEAGRTIVPSDNNWEGASEDEPEVLSDDDSEHTGDESKEGEGQPEDQSASSDGLDSDDEAAAAQLSAEVRG